MLKIILLKTEQVALSPSNLVAKASGVSPDKMLQGRSCSVIQMRIVIAWVQTIMICQLTAPHATVARNYQRGGQMAGTQCPFSNGKSMSGVSDVNYGPNSQGGPKANAQYKEPPLKISGDATHYDHVKTSDDYTQAGNLYRILPRR